MRTSFVESMGPWAAEEQDTNNQGSGGAKGDARDVEVNVPTPQPAPKK